MAGHFLFRARLARELDEWVDEGLVQPGQAQALRARYAIGDSESTVSFGYMVLVGLAVLCAGLALLLVVSHNWEDIPRAVRMISLILLTAGLNGQGIRAWHRGQPATAVRWLFAGGLAYGATIMLIAQIYHIGEHFPDGIFWWALGVLPMAVLTGSRLLHLLQLVLAIFWMWAQSHFSLPLLFPVFVLALLWQQYRHGPTWLLLSLALFGAGQWWHLAYSQLAGNHWIWDAGAGHLVAYSAAALMLLAASLRLATAADSRWRDSSQWLMRLLTWAGLVVLLVFSFDEAFESFMRGLQRNVGPSLVVLCLADLWLVWQARLLAPAKIVTLVLPALLVNFMVFAGFLLPASGQLALFLAVLVNLVLLGCGVRMIVRGLETRQATLFYTGVVSLLLLALMRYLSLMGDYLGSALMFMVAASVLFAAARYWQRSGKPASTALAGEV